MAKRRRNPQAHGDGVLTVPPKHQRVGHSGGEARPRLLVDVSQLVQLDYKSGVQRVVRSLIGAWLALPPQGYEVEPVYAVPGSHGYRMAKGYPAPRKSPEADPLVQARKGDVFLGLDLSFGTVLSQEGYYRALRAAGVSVYFVVYDLLPVLMPQVFSEGSSGVFTRWLKVLAQADGALCISRAVADELTQWLDQAGPARPDPFRIGWFHLGADLQQSVPSQGLPVEAEAVLGALAARPTFLMVGTVEPRKGQAQALAAFERLWAAGEDVNLVIVGRFGWMTEKLCHRLRRVHPERGRRLFWLDEVSDEYLERIYAASTCLLAPSEGEGFGLPLIEAAQHGLPLLARDLPVFREVAGAHAFYFQGREPEALSRALLEWLGLHRAGRAPASSGLSWLTWQQSADQALDVVLRGAWPRTWASSPRPGSDPEGGDLESLPLDPPGTWARTIGVDARALLNPPPGASEPVARAVHHLEALAQAAPSWLFVLFLDSMGSGLGPLQSLATQPNIRLQTRAQAGSWALDLFHVPDLMLIPLDQEGPWGLARPGTPTTVGFQDLLPLVMREDYLDQWTPGARQAYLRRLNELKRAKVRILTPSIFVKEELVRHLGLPEGRVEVIGAALIHPPCHPAAEAVQQEWRDWGIERPFFLLADAMGPQKRLGTALTAFALLQQRHPCRLVVAGPLDNPMLRAYQEGLQAKGIENILFTGALKGEALASFHQGATALLHPSIHEGFPSTVLQAMAEGCPVISTRTSSLPEVLGEAGILVAADDAPAMAEAMARLLEDEALGRSLREQGAGRAADFTWEGTALRTKALWERMLGGPEVPVAEAGPAGRMGVRWQGSQFVFHSLAHVNRQFCLGLIRSGEVDLSLLPYERHQFDGAADPDFRPLASCLDRALPGRASVHVRHQWPPNFQAPEEGAWVMMQPWEYGGIPREWIEPMSRRVDEIWAYTSWVRDRYIESGVPEDKVVVVPLGVDTDRFQPEGPRFPLRTRKTFRFLFLGGTIPRKGIDLLLEAYSQAFRASDDVCLVIKGQGGEVYRGHELTKTLQEMQEEPGAPEIEYHTENLSEPDLAALYRSCDAFVMPYRGEGFGLPIAEAMASGLPVIVTGRGAAMDFIQEDWAYLLPSRVRPIPRVDHFEPGPVGFWVEEPDLQALVACLRRVFEAREEGQAKGRLGRAHALAELSWARSTAIQLERLKVLAARRPCRFEPEPPPPPAREALLYRPDFTSAAWVEVLVSYLEAFQPGEPVALLLWLAEGSLSAEEAQEQLLAILTRMGRESFPDLALVASEAELEVMLAEYGRAQWIPEARGAVVGLEGWAGLRFARARERLA